MIRGRRRPDTAGLNTGRTHGYVFNKGIDVNQHPLKTDTYYSSKNFDIGLNGSLQLRKPAILKDDKYTQDIGTGNNILAYEKDYIGGNSLGVYITNNGIYVFNVTMGSPDFNKYVKLPLYTSNENYTYEYKCKSNASCVKIGRSIVISGIFLEEDPERVYFGRYTRDSHPKLEWITPKMSKGTDIEDLDLYVDTLGKIKNNYDEVGFFVYMIQKYKVDNANFNTINEFLTSKDTELVTKVKNEEEIMLRVIFDTNKIRYDNPDTYYAYWKTSIDGGENWEEVPEFLNKFEGLLEERTVNIPSGDKTYTENVKMVVFHPDNDDELISERADFLHVTPVQGQLYKFYIVKGDSIKITEIYDNEYYENTINTANTNITSTINTFDIYEEKETYIKKIKDFKINAFHPSTEKDVNFFNDAINTTNNSYIKLNINEEHEEFIPYTNLIASSVLKNSGADKHLFDVATLVSKDLELSKIDEYNPGQMVANYDVSFPENETERIPRYMSFRHILDFETQLDINESFNVIFLKCTYANGEEIVTGYETTGPLSTYQYVPNIKIDTRILSNGYHDLVNIKLYRPMPMFGSQITYQGVTYDITESKITIEDVDYWVPIHDVAEITVIQNETVPLYKYELTVKDIIFNDDIDIKFQELKDMELENPKLDTVLNINVQDVPDLRLGTNESNFKIRFKDYHPTDMASFGEAVITVGVDWIIETNDIPIPSMAENLDTFGRSIFAYGGQGFENNIIVSNPDEFYFPISRLLDIPGMSGRNLTAMLFWRNYILSSFEDSIHLSERVPDGYLTKPVNTFIGIDKNDKPTLKSVLNSIVFKNKNKIYSLTPSYSSSTDSLLYLKTLSDKLGENFTPSDTTSLAYVTDAHYNVLVNHSTPEKPYTIMYKYHLDKGIWTIHTFDINVKFISTLGISNIELIDDKGKVYQIDMDPSLLKNLPYGDYLNSTIHSIELLNELIDEKENEYKDEEELKAAYKVIKDEISPIKYAVDSGEKSPSLNGMFNFTETKILFFESASNTMDIKMYIDGRLHKHHPDIVGRDTKVHDDSMLWAEEIIPSGLKFKETLFKSDKDIPTFVKEITLKSSGKGKTVRHIISGESVSPLNINMVYYKYRNLNMN